MWKKPFTKGQLFLFLGTLWPSEILASIAFLTSFCSLLLAIVSGKGKCVPPFFCLLLTAGQTLKIRPEQEGLGAGKNNKKWLRLVASVASQCSWRPASGVHTITFAIAAPMLSGMRIRLATWHAKWPTDCDEKELPVLIQELALCDAFYSALLCPAAPMCAISMWSFAQPMPDSC